MGYYINHTKAGPLPPKSKAAALIANEDAVEVMSPEFNPDVALICVVDNGSFEAAGFCFSREEMMEFSKTYRPTRWLTMDLARAKELTGYKR